MGTFGESRRARRDRRGGGGFGGRGCKGGKGGWETAGGPLRPLTSRGDGGWGDKPDYKTAALCKQVRRVVGMTLAGECGDPVLQGLIVDEVLPAPNAGRLLVRVMLRVEGGAIGGHEVLVEVLHRLARVQGLLRARVGETIARKRTPELAFDVVAMSVAAGCHPSADGEPLEDIGATADNTQDIRGTADRSEDIGGTSMPRVCDE